MVLAAEAGDHEGLGGALLSGGEELIEAGFAAETLLAR
jgi:hypothetical protein